MIHTSPSRHASRPYVSSVEAGADLEVAEEDRKAGGLTEHAVLVVEQRHRAVLHLVDHGRVCRADQRGVHLVSGRRERAADDLGGDRIDRSDRHLDLFLLADLDHDRPEVVDSRGAPRRHDRGRGGLDDHGRALEG